MNIIGLNVWNRIAHTDPNALRVGQRLLIEIIQLDPLGQGRIKINGEELEAVIETKTQAQPGDKFWALVKETGGKVVVLTKDVSSLNPSQEQVTLSPSNPRQDLQFQTLNQTLSKALQKAQTDDWNALLTKTMLANALPESSQEAGLVDKFVKLVPLWSQLNGENGPALILNYMRQLGLDYEKRLFQFFRLHPGENEAAGIQAQLRSTIKGQLMAFIQQGDLDTTEQLHNLLEHLTGQQAALMSGREEQAYIWLNLPIQTPQQTLNTQIAVQSDRQKNKLDLRHCRIGISLETPALGKIGVDGYVFEDTLSLRILTSVPEELDLLLQGLKQETIDRFSRLGFKLLKLETEPLKANSEFESFVSGQPHQGVDHYA